MTENRTLIHVLDVNILSVYTCSIIHKEIKDCYAYFCFALGEKKRRGGSENTCLSVSVQLQFFLVSFHVHHKIYFLSEQLPLMVSCVRDEETHHKCVIYLVPLLVEDEGTTSELGLPGSFSVADESSTDCFFGLLSLALGSVRLGIAFCASSSKT